MTISFPLLIKVCNRFSGSKEIKIQITQIMHVKIKLFVTLEDTEMETGKRIMVIASIKPQEGKDARGKRYM